MLSNTSLRVQRARRGCVDHSRQDLREKDDRSPTRRSGDPRSRIRTSSGNSSRAARSWRAVSRRPTATARVQSTASTADAAARCGRRSDRGASACATRSWSSRSMAVKNGSASVRRDRSSETGQQPLAEAVALAHVRLQVDRREIAARRDALPLELGDHVLAVDAAVERDDVDEPRADVVGVVLERHRHALDVREQLAHSGPRPRAAASGSSPASRAGRSRARP